MDQNQVDQWTKSIGSLVAPRASYSDTLEGVDPAGALPFVEGAAANGRDVPEAQAAPPANSAQLLVVPQSTPQALSPCATGIGAPHGGGAGGSMPAREKELRGFLLTQQPEHRPSAARQHAAHPTVEKLCQYAAFVKAQQLNGALVQGTVPDRLIREERSEQLFGGNFFERKQMLLDHRDAIKRCFTDNAELVGQMVQKFFLVENTQIKEKVSHR